MTQKIPEKEYKEILEKIPVCCVDLVIYSKERVLLVYRKNEPCKNEWWIPGGRLYKNETLEEGAIRKAKEEIGIEIKIKKLIGTYEFFCSKGPFNNLQKGIHTVNITFLTEPLENNLKIIIDETSSNYKWINKIEKDLHPYIKKVLKDSKVFG